MCGDKTQVKKLSITIKKEIKCLTERYVYALIDNLNYRDVWKVIKQLGWLVSKTNQSSIDVDKLNREFIVGKPPRPVRKLDNLIFPHYIVPVRNSSLPEFIKALESCRTR